MSFVGDQTSYMSICVGEGLDDSLSQLSAQELRQKVSLLVSYSVMLTLISVLDVSLFLLQMYKRDFFLW